MAGYIGLEPKWDSCYNYKMNKKFPIIKVVILIVLSFIWFILVQSEYEMITKPNLQNDFPIIKGIFAVYFLGLILLIIAVLIIMILYSMRKSKRNSLK
jgi:uncharacterized integral membrane protein